MIDLQRAFSKLDTTRIWELLNELRDKLNEVIGRVNEIPVGSVIEAPMNRAWSIGANGTIPGSELQIPFRSADERWAINAELDLTNASVTTFSLYANGSDTGKKRILRTGTARRGIISRRWYVTGYTGTVQFTLVAGGDTTGGEVSEVSSFTAERIL